MDKNFYLELARSGRRMPIATHLVLHEKSDPEAILIDGEQLAAVMLETAERFGNPLALPIMDLTLEKDILLRTMGVPPEQTESFHFDALPDANERDYFNNIPTSLSLEPDQVDNLREIASKILYNDKDFRRFVKDLGGRMPEKPVRIVLPAPPKADGAVRLP